MTVLDLDRRVVERDDDDQGAPIARRHRRAEKAVDPDAGFRSARPVERVVAGTPWEERDLLRVGRAALLGAVGIGVSWFAARGADEWSRQLLWVAVGVGAVLLTAVGIVQWLMTGMGTVRMVRREVVNDLQAIASARSSRDGVSAGGDLLVVAPGMQRVHRSDCAFVIGKDVEEIGVREITARELRSCEACGA